MAGSDVSTVTHLLPRANEGFSTTLGSTILSGATTVPLTSITGLTNGTTFIGIIEPGATNQQVFTGIVDTGGSQVTGVKWTRGTNVAHSAGVQIVDYLTGTAINMLSKWAGVQHNDDGTHGAVTATSVTISNGLTVSGGSVTVPNGSLLPASHGFSGASVKRTTTLTIPTGSSTRIPWEAENYDVESYHSTSSNTTRIVVPRTGYYSTGIMLGFNTWGTGARLIVNLVKNNSFFYELWDSAMNSSNEPSISLTIDVAATAGDYFEFEVYQDTGIGRDVSLTTFGWIRFNGV
jgi:hypothetical protein